MEDEIPQIPVEPIAPETVVHEHVATPVVHVAQPASDELDKTMSRLEDSYHQLTLKLGEMSGKLDAMVSRQPEPVVQSVASNEPVTTHEVEEEVPDAVSLTVDDKATKPAKVQPQEHKRKGLRRSR